EAAAAFGADDRAGAAALLDPVMPEVTSIGGSDAQDDLFRQTYLRGLQAAGRHTDATAYFERMTTGKAPTPLDRALAGCARWWLPGPPMLRRITSLSPDHVVSTVHTLMSTSPSGRARSRMTFSVTSVATFAVFFGHDTQIIPSGATASR